ncbi:hypothetical protein E3N88_35083 [Mikania micrantha]|uniref:Uncharacterized protein n=1 Tax=Mikania micrantha TaxID=192012 RepID=A0A5N6M2R9_9ASTR|nr:hypothetical protein E3N88_35083 [Mikania micrantha]
MFLCNDNISSEKVSHEVKEQAMSSGRVRNFRRRAEEDDKDEDDKEKTITPSTTTASKKTQSKPPQAGVYTKEALLELQKNSKSLGGSTARSRPPLPKSEPVIVLKGMIKPVVDDSLTGRKYDDGESDRDDSLDRGVIPDQAMIDAIRAKRERLRQSRAAAPDFIALEGGSNHGEAEGLSDEEPEFQGRSALIGEKNDIKKGVFEDVVVDLGKTTIRKETEVNFSDNRVDDEEDEEDKMWEEEQFRKGLGKRMDEGVVTRGSNLTEDAHVECDAIVMDGKFGSFGVVGAVPDRISSKDRKLSGSSLPSNVQQQAGAYTKEALLELQKNSKSLGSSTARSRPPLPKSEPVIVLKGMIKPVVDDSLTGRKYDDGESDRDDSLDRALDGGSNHGEAEGLSDEEPEFQGRIALIGEKNDIKKGVFEDVVVDLGKTTIRKETEVNFSDNGVDDEEDEEDKYGKKSSLEKV